MAETLEKALNMPQRDMEYRRERDTDFIKNHPSSLWAQSILNDLDQLNNKGSKNNVSRFPEHLSETLVKRAYENAGKQTGISEFGSRLFVLDYGGTLLHKEKYDIYMKQTLSAIDGRKPSDTVMECIKQLSNDPRNVVVSDFYCLFMDGIKAL